MEIQKLTVLHTNDIHSRFERMPKIAYWLKQQRQDITDQQLLVIDCGDHIDRVRMETEGTEGLANIYVMNEAGYDYAVPGNNEGLTIEPERLLELYKEHARFKVLAANMYRGSSLPEPLLPFDIVHKGNIRVGLIGVTVDFTSFYELLGWDIQDPIATVQRTVEHMKPKADVIILVSHLGIAHDQRIAEHIAGIDVIIGGHTHHLLMQGEKVGTTLLAGAGKFGEYTGRIDLEVHVRTKEITHIQAQCFSTDLWMNDDSTEKIIKEERAKAKRNLSRPVAELSSALEIHWSKESPFGNLLAAGLRKWTGAQIGLVNSGQILHSLPPGQVTRQIMLEICPSPINPCKLQLAGKHIRQSLEQSLLPEMQQMPIKGYGFRGEILGSLCIDGAVVEYDPSGRPGGKILKILLESEDGSYMELEDEQLVSVGTIDMFTFGAGYLSLKNDKHPLYYLPEFIRDVLAEQLREPSELERAKTERWIARK
ncbi:bifunctional metallophosphatase/5'-nucleotidase [Marinicrinis lubricantis]|uniref:Bifunctional metallophosphatase/5'-nucleotidase n=1 Tax=Marinicrinis lubricantis TaxID=2086470 RepID=A0ABW1IH09_9BACL